MARNRKGAVSVRDRNGNITLVWNYGGKRYYLAIGLPKNAKTLGLAEVTKNQIESDIVTGVFDETLEKYRPPHQKKQTQPVKPIAPFIEEFLKKPIKPQTLQLYSSAVRKFKEYFGDRKSEITKSDASDFIEWLRPQIAVSTLKAYIVRLSAIWDWALEEEKITASNPWKNYVKRIKPTHTQPKPFTKDEVSRILEAFSRNHYGSFIEFLFRTGCRLGEAIALKWEDVAEDCSRVFISSPKTHTSRVVTLSVRTQQLLLEQSKDSGYVFPAPKGGRIIATNFRAKVWKPLLANLGIPYRKPHNMRITLVSHQLENGVDPVHLSRITGHSTQVMFKHYLANTGIETVIPEVF